MCNESATVSHYLRIYDLEYTHARARARASLQRIRNGTRPEKPLCMRLAFYGCRVLHDTHSLAAAVKLGSKTGTVIAIEPIVVRVPITRPADPPTLRAVRLIALIP